MKIGLALSGGGVLGVAHIGLLKQLEKNKIKIDIIAGSSAGAIIGALFASGGTQKIDEFLADLDKEGVFDPRRIVLRPLPDRIFDIVRSSLKKHLPEHFYELETKFFAVATNFSDGRSTILDDGDPTAAVMASSAYPGVFSAQEINGKSLIDGGISTNLPAGFLREKGADFVIGSSLYNIVKLEEYDSELVRPNRLMAVRRALDIMQKEMADYELKNCDFAYTPPIETFAWYNFDKMAKIKEIGENYAEENIRSLIKKIRAIKKKSFLGRIMGE